MQIFLFVYNNSFIQILFSISTCFCILGVIEQLTTGGSHAKIYQKLVKKVQRIPVQFHPVPNSDHFTIFLFSQLKTLFLSPFFRVQLPQLLDNGTQLSFSRQNGYSNQNTNIWKNDIFDRLLVSHDWVSFDFYVKFRVFSFKNTF